MTYEFEGKTEKEAIEKAMTELGLKRDSFDVEILEVQRGGLFKKGFIKIRLHTDEGTQRSGGFDEAKQVQQQHAEKNMPEFPADEEFESKVIAHLTAILDKMEIASKVTVHSREKKKLVLNIDTKDSAIIIGKKGRTLDALQLIVTLYSKKIRRPVHRITLECENYRLHREESLIRLAYSVAAKVRSSKRSILLEPMNPYDRRLIHTSLEESDDVETKSEGEGLYKQVRVIYKNSHT